jgi:membrane fusion protein (multidrug efflux system)
MTAMTDSSSLIPDLEVPPSAPSAATPPRKRSRALVAFPFLVALATAIGGGTYWLGLGQETTNDASVEGHVSSVNARVTGQVKEVLVKDNQHVNAGDVLVVLDDRDLAVKRASANADLAAARAQLRAAETQLDVTRKSADSNLIIARGGIAQASAVEGTTQATIERAQADVTAAESRLKLAQIELDRAQRLVDGGAVTQAELDIKRAGLEQAHASLGQAQATLASARANVSNSSGTVASARGRLIAAESGPAQVDAALAQVELARARVDQAQAALDQAELNLSYTQIRAEVSGVVARRSVEVGQLAAPERPLLAIVPLDDTWVVANYKEDQIAEIQPGQPVRVHIDTYDREFTGHVDSLAGGTGSRFSLLPPDNASGNFTKVVQRVPVLIRLDPHQDVLRPGMSATTTVYVK